jgi:cystathionine beta-lyase
VAIDLTVASLDELHLFPERGRIALSRGLDYGPEGAGHVRLNFATSPDHLAEALARMRAALDTAS